MIDNFASVEAFILIQNKLILKWGCKITVFVSEEQRFGVNFYICRGEPKCSPKTKYNMVGTYGKHVGSPLR